MATITEIQLQDGTVHQLGGGGNTTYTISKSGSTITLTGSGGDTSSVTDANTTYSFSISGNVLTVTPSSGSPQTITLPDDDTTYSLSASGDTITLTGSDGTTSSVTVSTTDTTYALSKSGSTITLTGSDGTTTTVSDANTTYTFSVSGHTLTITPSSGSAQTVTLPDNNTTYTFALSGHTLTITGSDGTTKTLTLPDTTYPSMTQAQAEAGTSTTNSVISPKVLHDVIESLDDDTTYTISISGNTLTLTPSNGTAQTITLPDDDTTYSLSISGNTITLTGSDGSTSSVNVTDTNTTYALSKSGSTIRLTGSDGAVTTVTDANTTYTFSLSGHTLTVTPSSGSPQTITLPDNNTTYTLSISGHTLTLTDSNGNPQTITLPDNDTTYSISRSGDTVTLTGSDGSTSTFTLPAGTAQNTWYGTSSTAAATAAKVVTTSSGDFALTTGSMVRVKFTNANTYNGTATLNVDGTGAKNITRVGTTTTTRYYWTAGEVVDFVYDGTNFVMSNKGTATTTYYGLTKLSSATDSTSTSLAATPSAVKSAYDLANSKVSDVQVNGTSVVSGGVADIDLADVATTGDYDDLINKPSLFSGNYNDLTNKPTIPTVNNGTLTIQKNGTNVETFTANASSNKTANITVPTATSDLTNDSNFVSDPSYVHTDNNYTTSDKNKLAGIASGAEVNVQSDWSEANSASDAFIKNKPTIPTVGNATLTIQKNGTNVQTFTANASANKTANITVPTATSDLTNDSNFVSDASYVHTDNNFTNTEKSKLAGIANGAEVNVQSNWNQTDSSADDFIKNKPTIPTVPSASTSSPLMDGTASAGSATAYARGDHRHPTDTSRQATLVSGTNIKTVNGNSLLGSGNITISGGGGSGTSIPTANTLAEFDSTAHMNSTDMTAQEVQDFVDGLDYSQLTAVAFVTEVGADGNWTWRKYSDGTFDAWCHQASYTGVITAGSGSLYYLNASLPVPNSIGASTIIHANVEYTGGELTWCKLGTVSTASIGYTFCSSISRSTSTTRYVNAYIHGTYA